MTELTYWLACCTILDTAEVETPTRRATFAYYWRASKKAGLPAFHDRDRITRFGRVFTWLKCIFSPKATAAFLKWLEQTLQAAFERCRPAQSQRLVYEDDDFDVLQVIR